MDSWITDKYPGERWLLIRPPGVIWANIRALFHWPLERLVTFTDQQGLRFPQSFPLFVRYLQIEGETSGRVYWRNPLLTPDDMLWVNQLRQAMRDEKHRGKHASPAK